MLAQMELLPWGVPVLCGDLVSSLSQQRLLIAAIGACTASGCGFSLQLCVTSGKREVLRCARRPCCSKSVMYPSVITTRCTSASFNLSSLG